MKKVLIIITCFATLGLVACSQRFHLVHKIDVQQGNVVTQEMVDQLKPGMNRNQVQFIMESPLVIDVFHQDRWDYIYYFKPGYGEPTEERVSLFFEDDSLTRITGTLHPEETAAGTPPASKLTTVVVPPYDRVEPGLFNKIWHWIRFRAPGETE